MGRDSHVHIWRHFIVVEKKEKNKKGVKRKEATCRYCKTAWTNALVTRLEVHLEKCDDYKEYKTNQQEDEFDNNTSRVEQDMAVGVGTSNSQAQSSATNTSECEPSRSLSSLSNKSQNSEQGGGATKKICKLKQFMDTMTKDEIEHGNLLMGKAFYSCNISFNSAVDPHLINFLKFLRPAFVPAKPFGLRNKILDQEYDRVQKELKALIFEAEALGLISDGWTNTSGDGIINFIITCPSPMFYKSINRGTERETGVYVAEQWESIMVEMGVEKFLVIVTDCASNMRCAWDIITNKYPHISAVGCIAHALSNLMGDFMKIEGLKEIHKTAQKIVKEIKLSHVKHAAFKEKQSELYGTAIKALALYPKTRFGFVVLTLESLVRNKSALQAIVIDRSLKIDKDVRKFVLDEESTWPCIERGIELLKIIAQGITVLERNDALLSEAIEFLFIVYDKVEGFLDNYDDFCSIAELRNVKDSFTHRFEMSMRPIHYATNILDPRFQGRRLNDVQRLEGLNYITKLAEHLNIVDEGGELLANVGDFRDHTGFFSHGVLWSSARSYKPAAWWKGLCGEQKVAPIASRLLQLPCSGVPAEHNWSVQSAVHTKVRNRLDSQIVQKLVCVKGNLSKDKTQKKVPCLADINKFLVDLNFKVVDITNLDEEEEVTGTGTECDDYDIDSDSDL